MKAAAPYVHPKLAGRDGGPIQTIDLTKLSGAGHEGSAADPAGWNVGGFRGGLKHREVFQQ
jgi:hypothetical protein